MFITFKLDFRHKKEYSIAEQLSFKFLFDKYVRIY